MISVDVDLVVDVDLDVDFDGDGDVNLAARPLTPPYARAVRVHLALATAILLGCGNDDSPDDCEQLQRALCERTAECVALGSTQTRVRDDCRRALARQLVCHQPGDDQGPEFDLCLDASESMPCDYVSEQYDQDMLVSPISCDLFLGPF